MMIITVNKNNYGVSLLEVMVAAFIFAVYVPRKMITGAIIYMSNLAIVSLSVFNNFTDRSHNPMIK